MRVSYFKVISLFMYQLSMAVNEICRYDVGVGSKYQNAQEMFSNIQRWREQKHTHSHRDHLWAWWMAMVKRSVWFVRFEILPLTSILSWYITLSITVTLMRALFKPPPLQSPLPSPTVPRNHPFLHHMPFKSIQFSISAENCRHKSFLQIFA